MNMNTLDSHPWQASQPACQIFQSPKFNSSSRREKKGHIKNERHVVCEVELASQLAGRQWQYLPHSMLAPSLRDWKLMRKGNQHATKRERDGREREKRREGEKDAYLFPQQQHDGLAAWLPMIYPQRGTGATAANDLPCIISIKRMPSIPCVPLFVQCLLLLRLYASTHGPREKQCKDPRWFITNFFGAKVTRGKTMLSAAPACYPEWWIDYLVGCWHGWRSA